MRTIYGVVPALTSEGLNSGRLAPVVIELNSKTNRSTERALSRVADLVPQEIQLEDGNEEILEIETQPDEFRIGLGEVSHGEIPRGLHVPELSIRVRPNFGLKPERLKDGKSFGIVEIVAEDEVPRKDGKQDRGVVVVRDSVMRGETEAVSFTNEFMRRTLEGGLNVGDVIQDGHQEELARSVMNVATTQEGGWIAKLGMPRWGGDSAANAVPERQGAMKMLRDLADPAKRELGLPSLGEVSNALLQINETIGQTNIVEGSVHMEGSGRKEAI